MREKEKRNTRRVEKVTICRLILFTPPFNTPFF